ncbi:MAG: FAD-binding oxidoreductase [Nitrospirae bacterium]|nr:FAD-binding oxidoreductase [Nitrospirota bacterium]
MGSVSSDPELNAAFGEDLSPSLVIDAKRGKRPPPPPLVVLPESEAGVVKVLRWAAKRGVPLVPYGGGSGVCGGAVPGKEAVVLSLGRLNKIVELDRVSGVVRAQAGVYGPELERFLNSEGFTLGHFPASFELSTVGGWLATRSAGQASTRYGKIEDMVVALRVVLADGRVVQTVPAPRAATGSNLVQLFVGSEGTLGVITEAHLRVWPRCPQPVYRAYSFESFDAGAEWIRRVLQAGCVPSVIRLYDEAESAWYGSKLKWEGGGCLLVTVWECEEEHVAVAERVGGSAQPAGRAPAEEWEKHRFAQVSDYRKLRERPDPIAAETIEVSALWKDVPSMVKTVKEEIRDSLCTVHLSHAYPEGAGLYFTFVLQADTVAQVAAKYRAIWNHVMKVCLDHGAAISHHHGIGTLRAPWMRRSLGTGLDVQRALKRALDPKGILNPGKLGL